MYTRAYLNEVKKNPRNAAVVLQDLMAMVINKQELTIAESRFLGTALNSWYTDNPEAMEQIKAVRNGLEDFIFWEKSLLYQDDFEGQLPKQTPYGRLTNSEIKDDVMYFQTQYEKWLPFIEKNNHSDQLAKVLAEETRQTIKEILKCSKQQGEDLNRQRYIHKSLVLHSKLAYIKVKEYYQEKPSKEESGMLFGRLVVIDCYTYVHILLGHFAEKLKFNRPGKSYYQDTEIDLDDLPKIIFDLLECYEKNVIRSNFVAENIFLKFKGTIYAIWFKEKTRKQKGKADQHYLHVATFYPVTLSRDLDKVKLLTPVMVNNQLFFYR